MDGSILDHFGNDTLIEALCTTLVGQDLSPFEVQRLACVCSRFYKLLYSPAFFSHVFATIQKLQIPEAKPLFLLLDASHMLKVGKRKEWNNFLWRKAQAAIVFHNLPMLRNVIASGFPVSYTGLQKITPLYLCVKHNFGDGYEELILAGAERPTSFVQPNYGGPALPVLAPSSASFGYEMNSNPHRHAMWAHQVSEYEKTDIDRTLFGAIEEHDRVYLNYNHVYMSVAYHSLDVLKRIHKLFPKDIETAMANKYRISIGIDYKQLIIGMYVPLSTANYSLVTLEILRKRPSVDIIKFFIECGYQFTIEDRQILASKLNAKNEIIGCVMGSPEDRADLPKISDLLSLANACRTSVV